MVRCRAAFKHATGQVFPSGNTRSRGTHGNALSAPCFLDCPESSCAHGVYPKKGTLYARPKSTHHFRSEEGQPRRPEDPRWRTRPVHGLANALAAYLVRNHLESGEPNSWWPRCPPSPFPPAPRTRGRNGRVKPIRLSPSRWVIKFQVFVPAGSSELCVHTTPFNFRLFLGLKGVLADFNPRAMNCATTISVLQYLTEPRYNGFVFV
mgnify:CR=1 FL=1